MRALNLTLLTDLYELTMMQGYFKNPTDKIVVFDAFYRQNPCGGAYAVSAGLDQVIEYIKNLHFTTEDIDYLRETGLFGEDFLEYLRGFHFETINIYESEAVDFKVVEGGLLPPFVSVHGLGEAAARDTVEKRMGQRFISVEEFSICCNKLSKTHIEQLKELGSFAGMAETSQLTLF